MSYTGTLHVSTSIASHGRPAVVPPPQGIFALSDLLPLCDFVAVPLAALGALLVHVVAFATVLPATWMDLGNFTFIGALLATCILYDQQFAMRVMQPWTIVLSYCLRCLLVIATVFMAGSATDLTAHVPDAWLQLWLGLSLLLTVGCRWYVAMKLRSRLQRSGKGNYERR